MCGVVAAYLLAGVSTLSLKEATKTLIHRGPDHQGIWVSKDKKFGLGSARLALNDVQDGNQPLHSRCGKYIAVVNGEIYGHAKIKKKLEKLGCIFTSSSDSEVLLQLYAKYGHDALTELRGEFAFVIYDKNRGELFAARDRFGIKPLYYTKTKNGIIFASEIKALMSMGVEIEIHQDYFCQNFIICNSPDQTIFKNIKQLPPGHFMTVTSIGVQIEKYWDLDYPTIYEKSETSHKALCEDFHTTISEAVSLRNKADFPIASFLSGGIDSSFISGLMSKQKKTTTFTVGFDHSDFNERYIAARSAKHFKSVIVPIEIDSKGLAENLEKTVWHAETIGENHRATARFLQSKTVSSMDYKAVQTGEGADEILAGYMFSRYDLLASEAELKTDLKNTLMSRMSPSTLNWFKQYQSGNSHSNTLKDYINEKLGYCPIWLLERITQRSQIAQILFKSDILEQKIIEKSIIRFLESFDASQLLDRSGFYKSLWLWNKSILPNVILTSDRLEMANSVEARLPFLDHHVFQKTKLMPYSLLFKKGFEKYPLRNIAKGLVTQEVVTRPKRPFEAPPILLETSDPLFKLYENCIYSNHLYEGTPLCPTKSQAYFGKLVSYGGYASSAVDRLLCLLVSTLLLKKSLIQ